MPLHYVNPNTLPQVWPIAAPLLQKAIDVDPSAVTLDQVEFSVRTGKSLLLVWDEPNVGITGAAILEIIDYPRQRIGHINLMGGKGLVRKESFEELKELTRRLGATTLQCWAKGAVARLYNRVGLHTTHQVMRCEL